MAEREEQKRRTRADLLAGARALLSQGKAVTVTAAAKEAGISKATAYRYYSDPALLVAEAGLDFRAKSYEVVTQGCTSLREKLVALSLYYFDLAVENEATFRSYLGLFLQASVDGGSNAPERGARRVHAYRRALDETQPPIAEDEASRIAAALSVGTGFEALMALVDIAKCERNQARELVREICEAIIDRLLSKAV